MNSHFKAICGLNDEILRTIGVDKDKVKNSLKQNLKDLKSKYWSYLFNQLKEIRSKLTSEYRKQLQNKFVSANNVDFNYDNIYATVLWILKNANDYCDKQITDLYEKLSDFKYVKPYKSNQKFFEGENQRWYNAGNTHYTLDYRLVCDKLSFGYRAYDRDWEREQRTKDTVDDICVVAENLGFITGGREYAQTTGTKYNVYYPDGSVLFEYKTYQNGNTHIKMDLEFSKAFNVEASRLLGWIKSKEEAKEEFQHTHLKGCEKYFKTNFSMMGMKSSLMLTEKK